MADQGPRITAVRNAADVEVALVAEDGMRRVPLEAIADETPFRPHPGWRGHVERTSP
jgi:hypothetical protein